MFFSKQKFRYDYLIYVIISTYFRHTVACFSNKTGHIKKRNSPFLFSTKGPDGIKKIKEFMQLTIDVPSKAKEARR